MAAYATPTRSLGLYKFTTLQQSKMQLRNTIFISASLERSIVSKNVKAVSVALLAQ